MKTIYLVIPCYNEAVTIAKVVDDFRRTLPDADIYVYDNNSSDGTGAIAAEHGACAGKKDLATLAKKLNLDAVHDTVHEMAKDEARHGCGFKGLHDRYFGK